MQRTHSPDYVQRMDTDDLTPMAYDTRSKA